MKTFKKIFCLTLLLSIYSCVENTFTTQAQFKFLNATEIEFLARGHIFEPIDTSVYEINLDVVKELKTEKNYDRLDIHKETRKGWFYQVRNGVIKEKAQMTENLRTGLSIVYQENDNPMFLGHYENDIKTGKWKEFYPNGNQYGRGEYFDNLKTGEWMYYDENGSPMEEHIYRGEPGNYTFIQYDSLGRHRADGAYTNGKESGEWKAFDDSMRLIKLYNFVDGKPVGYFEESLENGQMAKGNFSEESNPEGEMKIYNREGDLLEIMVFENDSLVETRKVLKE